MSDQCHFVLAHVHTILSSAVHKPQVRCTCQDRLASTFLSFLHTYDFIYVHKIQEPQRTKKNMVLFSWDWLSLSNDFQFHPLSFKHDFGLCYDWKKKKTASCVYHICVPHLPHSFLCYWRSVRFHHSAPVSSAQQRLLWYAFMRSSG